MGEQLHENHSATVPLGGTQCCKHRMQEGLPDSYQDEVGELSLQMSIFLSI